MRISVMTAELVEATRNNLACQIVREGGKPLTMRCSKTDCAIDGVRTATDELRVMRLTASRNLPDAIVGHQRQSAVDIVPVPRRQDRSTNASS